MTLSFVCVLPAIDPGLAHECLASMHSELRRRTLLVDNTGMGRIGHVHRKVVGAVHAADRNLGVPRSWNLGVEEARRRDADYLVIVSQSIRFGRMGGIDFLAHLERAAPDAFLDAQFGWKLIAVNVGVFGRVGPFDEVFSPAYYEESDWMYRAHLAGCSSPWYNDRPGREQVTTIDATSAGDAMTLVRGLIPDLDYGAQRAKYVQKWGGIPREETYAHPYDDATLDWTWTGERPRTTTGGIPDDR